MATVAFILDTIIFFIGGGVFMTVFLLVVHAVSALARHAARSRRLRKEMEFYEHYFKTGRLYD